MLPDLGRPRLRAAARDARLHRPRDRRQPRRGDARAGPDAAAEPLLRDRARRRDHRRRRGRRAGRLPGRERPDGARRRVVEGAARGDRRGASRPRSRPGRGRPASCTSASPVPSSSSPLRRRRSRASPGWRTRSASIDSCRRSFGRINRRTLVSPQAIVAVMVISIGLVIGTGLMGDDVEFLASLYSFGVLLAFAAAQLAVIRLRFTEPDLPAAVPGAARRAAARRAARDRLLARRDGDAPGRTLCGADLAGARARSLPRRPPPGAYRTAGRGRADRRSCRPAPSSGVCSCR